ncbi:MAG: hypothetical protein ACLU8W_09955 [Clostridia bacterium]
MCKITERIKNILILVGLIALPMIVFGVTYVSVRRLLWILGIPLMTVLALLLGDAI